jgi:hypothetical protein
MWRVGLLSDLTITLLSSYHLLHEERFRCKQIDLRAVCWILQIHPLLVWLFNFIPKYMRSNLQNISSGLGQSYELRKRAPWIGFIIRTIHQSRFPGNFSYPCSRSFKIRPDESTGNPADLKLELDRVEEKTREEKTWLTQQNSVKNPVTTH